LFAMAWKPCSFCRGIGVNFAVEFVFFLPWNPCSLWRGIFIQPAHAPALFLVHADFRGRAASGCQEPSLHGTFLQRPHGGYPFAAARHSFAFALFPIRPIKKPRVDFGPHTEAGNSHCPAESVRRIPWQEDVEKAVRTVCAERGPEWIDYQVNRKLAAPYCVRRGLVGLDGLISLYRDYRQLTDGLFQELSLAKLPLENSGRDWAAFESRILRELGL